MTVGSQNSRIICARCFYRSFRLHAPSAPSLHYGRSQRYSTRPSLLPHVNGELAVPREAGEKDEEQGRMSQRLSQMTEESIEQGGSSMKKAIEEGGFSEELKNQLEARIQDSTFRSENPAAFAEITMPSSAGQGTRSVATAPPWAGAEKLEDAALRMLDDAHKPLRGTRPARIPQPRAPSMSVDMRMKKVVQRSGADRLANARDRTSVYALSQDPSLSEMERENMRKILKERFSPGARPMPGSVQGLTALANERIEDAIARGQFKNLSRGKGKNVERDYNANSPFLDTTEYFMNKMIQKQEIVPPWIEKQQELVKSAAVFRGRIRADWKRHAARVIASKGGPIEAQVQRAEAYAAAEAAVNPKTIKTESMTAINHEGKLSQLTVTETPTPSSLASDSSIEVPAELASTSRTPLDPDTTSEETVPPAPSAEDPRLSTQPLPPPSTTPSPPTPLTPFRDPAWQSLEHAYHALAIKDLNSLTRTYNLQAPDLAKKPYFSLERELRSCFADVAPQLADAIRERARRPEKVRGQVVGSKAGGVLERFSMERGRVFDSRRPNYGFRDFWRDLWRRRV